MSRLDELTNLVNEFQQTDDISQQHHLLRSIGLKCVFLGVDARSFFAPPQTAQPRPDSVQCPHCQRNDFINTHALRAHIGRMHKNKNSN